MVLIRVMPDPKQAAPAQNQVPMVRIVTPSGKIGLRLGRRPLAARK